jgi:hypothetical protein
MGNGDKKGGGFPVELAMLAPGNKPAAKEKPHYLGHRDRLRERATAGGLSALPDYEVLELLLFRSIPRGDVKPLAKQLLARFGRGPRGSLIGPAGALQGAVGGRGERVNLRPRRGRAEGPTCSQRSRQHSLAGSFIDRSPVGDGAQRPRSR